MAYNKIVIQLIIKKLIKNENHRSVIASEIDDLFIKNFFNQLKTVIEAKKK